MIQILVIDDDPSIQRLLKRTLQVQGYQVTIAKNGEEGLTLANEIQPAMIICDWLMPGINGLDVCRKIKSNPELSTSFFILLTSMATVQDRIQGLDAGADDFLCKPIEMLELEARIRSGLRLYQLNQDLKHQKQLLESELQEAAQYVASLLPPPLIQTHLKINPLFIPSRKLGGDGFDYNWLDPDHLAIYLFDTAGHGLRAALPSVSVMNLLKNPILSQIDCYQPKQVLNVLNQTFPISDYNDKYFTIWYGVYQKSTRTITYSSAGHPPAILLSGSNTKVEQLKIKSLPIGLFSDSEFEEQTCQIEPNSILYIFSDGLYELYQENGSIWGLEEFINLLITLREQNNNDLETLLSLVKTHNHDLDFNDDISLLQIQFT